MASKDSPSMNTNTSRNWSILAIPAAYGLAFPPHLYFFARGVLASNYAYRNAFPRSNLEFLKGKIPEATWSSLLRARGAHLNALEGFPLFASAMLAGNYAKVPTSELNYAAGQYVAARVVYTTLYMTTTNEAMSYLRSGVYFWSVAIPFWVLFKAGTKLRDEGPEAKTL